MKWLKSPFLWGGLLIFGGVLLLLQNLGLIDFGSIFWVILFGLGGMFFLFTFFTNHENWWAIIPAGALLSLALAVGLGYYWNSRAVGGIFLVGFGITFAVLALIPAPNGRMGWAWIPAGTLSVLGFIMSATSGELIQFIWPAALIFGGALLLYYTLRPKSR